VNAELAVVLTAGGRVPRAQFAHAASLDDGSDSYDGDESGMIKALLKVGGRSLLEIALSAVLPVARGGTVVVVGHSVLKERLSKWAVQLVPEHREAHENLIAGLQAVVDHPRALYLTTDLPFVTAEAVRQFVDACPVDKGLCYAIVRRDVFDRRFPNSPSTYARLRDGEFVAGCAAVVSPARLLQRAQWIRRVAQRRKSLWKLALLAGGRVLWRYAIRQLTVADVELRAEQLLGIRCGAVESPPELGYDIDTPQEYLYALRAVADVGPA